MEPVDQCLPPLAIELIRIDFIPQDEGDRRPAEGIVGKRELFGNVRQEVLLQQDVG